MTGKEIFLGALNFEETPRLPVAVLDGYTWIVKRDQISHKDLLNAADFGASHVIKAFDEFAVDNVCANAHISNFFLKYMGGEIQYDKVGEAFEISKPPLKTLDEIKNFSVDELINQALADDEFVAGLKLIPLLKKHYGDERVIVGVSWGPFTVAGMMVGVQNFLTQAYDDEDSAVAIIEFSTQLIARFAQLLVEYGADVIMVGDPVSSGDMISPGMFEEYALPSVTGMVAALNKLNVKYLLHICGNTRARIKPLLDSGIAAFSVDTLNLEEALPLTRGNYAICGDMNPYDVLQIKTADEVFEHCLGRAKVAGRSGGFLLMPGCDLAPNIPLANIQAMVNAAHSFV
ncbi:uroporphyrinogen decarboxylase family protein [Candidatus Epulonipiscium viviparus]|uniref:uroporphyrinogen decarboxylase family protein n=1 Tax=Candidatus Epulonipiscium viviparus TaxID=420336 RepID=UPI00016C0B2A|nr:uroporphyrinogen decarboxylase family protein [Candidatus Epulopiscium viviparus]